MPRNGESSLTRDKWVIHVAVVLSYFGKAVTKGVSGLILGSPPLINDAIHGLIDIGEHGVIALVGRHARKEAEARFPLGRKPLLDVVGFVIGLSMAGLGVKCLKDGLAAALHALDLTLAIKESLPSWVLAVLPELTAYGAPAQLWVVGSVFTACSLVSLAVYRLEHGLARKHRLKEYADDAAELRQDAVLELATGLCVLGGWTLTLLLHHTAGAAGRLEPVNAVVMAVVLLGLCGYLFVHAKHAVFENINNLLHPGLDDETVQLLGKHLRHALPSGCALLNDQPGDVTAYTTGETLYVKGTIRIPRAQMGAGDAIRDHAEHIAVSFLQDKSEEVSVRFLISPEAWKADDVEREWRRLLKEVWAAEADDEVWPCFAAVKRGCLSEALALCERLRVRAAPPDAAFLLWVEAIALLFRDGAQAASVQAMDERVAGSITELSRTDSRAVALQCWRLLRAVLAGDIHGSQTNADIEDMVQALDDVVREDSGVHDGMRAEAEFVLGMLAERQDAYDLPLSDRRYRHALSLYLGSGFPLESDRLLNTWGHQKSLLYEIEEALYLLNRSRQIKELKGDRLGLSYTLGCLGDTHRRAGDFEQAMDSYAEDLRISQSLGLDHSVASVTCKLAEAEVGGGVVSVDESQIDSGIRRLKQLLQGQHLATQVGFFVRKGLVKGLLWKAALYPGEARDKLLSEAAAMIAETEPFSPYSEAHLIRIKGRLARLRGEAGAAGLLNQARDRFESMRRHVDARINSLQAICCQLEAAFCAPPGDERALAVEAACKELDGFVQSLQGLLGPTRERIMALLESVRVGLRSSGSTAQCENSLLALLEG